MSTRKSIDILSIRGFRSFRELDSFELRSLNVLIGSNGSGKSNFISFFRLLHELAEKRLNAATGKAGGADSLLYRGRKHTSAFEAELYFGPQRLPIHAGADRRRSLRVHPGGGLLQGPLFRTKEGPLFRTKDHPPGLGT